MCENESVVDDDRLFRIEAPAPSPRKADRPTIRPRLGRPPYDAPGWTSPDRGWKRRREQARDRFGLLLILLVGSFVALGFAEHTWARVLCRWAPDLRPRRRVPRHEPARRTTGGSALLALVSLAAIVLVAVEGDAANAIGEIAGVVVLDRFCSVAVLGRVLRPRACDDADTVRGGVRLLPDRADVQRVSTGRLNDLGNTPVFGGPVDRSVFSYFSFTTLTTVGFGDYTAVTDLGRRIAMIEAVIGQVFIATTLARLVSLYKSGGRGPSQPARVDSKR